MTTIELAKKYYFIYAAVGVHPSDIADLNEETFAWLREQTAWERTDVYKRQLCKPADKRAWNEAHR